MGERRRNDHRVSRLEDLQECYWKTSKLNPASEKYWEVDSASDKQYGTYGILFNERVDTDVPTPDTRHQTPDTRHQTPDTRHHETLSGVHLMHASGPHSVTAIPSALLM
ncbi:hypothetical protein CLCR_03744 [Cladophialophora carrionii]|uniref:Uncharacterized protein n=1 Tax=Cladophialophora carrionii TaxID=86049 RepID=A0A1C1CG17_9EURO|nr:hypothetical protein CLCR_03744 [Cladophialophora carrionii]